HTYSRIRVGVAGATGYTGLELMRRLARHPYVDIRLAMGSGASEPKRIPALARIWDDPIGPLDLDKVIAETDAVFLALPEAVAAEIAPVLAARGTRVFDLSGAFRLRDSAMRQKWYPHTPSTASINGGLTYGLTEHYRAELRNASLVACAGCYPTAAILSLRPLVAASLIDEGVIIDAKSGVSGAGKTPTERTHFSECHGSIAAYGVFAHRHAAEIEQEVGIVVTFVPHLVPIDRGILETIYARLKPGVSADDVALALTAAYADSPFVRLTGSDLPEIKHVVHTNFCDIGFRVDRPGGQLVMVAVIDNLVKGASGQAIQNFNVAYGFDEALGLN
ncbi:MAG: N-acetyl-gamma-glutamyl-phosphate reductase, partial [Acidobacteria bacterium]|nr:N-acetyl-gamma-glutamyl-phosphate reductase [Acidobacteriota bacterium]